ncbi:acyl-CoA thioesterase [Streptomyces albipurpureus]|uniref:Thioesterase family protein n=1 Tax=Streptomyces albipurpureus TaxID=2897419 RepID=A0ABT0UZL8_9ACTN|nr:acyl-CoA thioesterase domain-containing protein [Streptomyces sp. CWNU-1]MCM2393545.1 thioesterase family protein [Streptomyces sp. CWNU-1]
MYRTEPTTDGAEPAGSLLPYAACELVDFLSLERTGADLFHGWCHSGVPRQAFGGQVVAHSLAAAGQTVESGRPAHSLHGYFLRAGNLRSPIVYRVERLRDGRRYSSRRVTATQGSTVVFTLSASFKEPEPERPEQPERQPVMPVVVPPEGLPDAFEFWATHSPEQHREAGHAQVVSMRVVPERPGARMGGSRGIGQNVWFRARQPLPDDPLLHFCALTYFSDLSLGPTAALDFETLYPLRAGPSQAILASLDHAIWFHRQFRADEWLLFAQRSPSASDGRGFNTGEFWARDGTLVASVAQETALRREPS